MARRVAELEARFRDMGDDTWRLMPQMYKDRSDLSDPINAAWTNAMTAVADAHQCLAKLSKALAERASKLPLPTDCR